MPNGSWDSPFGYIESLQGTIVTSLSPPNVDKLWNPVLLPKVLQPTDKISFFLSFQFIQIFAYKPKRPDNNYFPSFCRHKTRKDPYQEKI